MIKNQLARFNRLDLISAPTALEKLERLSIWADRDIYIKRDDTTTLALGGNKVRKLEYLAADALAQGADTLITAGAIQSNHVRQTAALAARLGLGCVALLENPIGTEDPSYLKTAIACCWSCSMPRSSWLKTSTTPTNNCTRWLRVCAQAARSLIWYPSVAQARSVRWVMFAPGWNWLSRSSRPASTLRRLFWPPAARAPTAAWRWHWLTSCRICRLSA